MKIRAQVMLDLVNAEKQIPDQPATQSSGMEISVGEPEIPVEELGQFHRRSFLMSSQLIVMNDDKFLNKNILQ